MSKWSQEQELVDVDESRIRLSASSVKTHKRCPEQFRMSYVEELEPTKAGSGYGEMGSAVHEAIENVLEDEKTPPRYENQLRQELMTEFRQIDPDIDDKKWENAVSCLDTAATYLSDGDFEGSMEVKDLEKRFEFGLGRPDIKSQFSGIIDLTDEHKIIDWKTGKVREEAEIIQGSVYMKGFEELYGKMPDKIVFVYLKDGKERVRKPSDENWDKMIEYARQVVQDVQEDSFEANPSPGNCFFCGHEGYCSESKVGAGGISWWQWRKRRRNR